MQNRSHIHVHIRRKRTQKGRQTTSGPRRQGSPSCPGCRAPYHLSYHAHVSRKRPRTDTQTHPVLTRGGPEGLRIFLLHWFREGCLERRLGRAFSKPELQSKAGCPWGGGLAGPDLRLPRSVTPKRRSHSNGNRPGPYRSMGAQPPGVQTETATHRLL